MNHCTRDRNAIFLLVAALVGLTGFRLWYASALGLAPDEAYYRQWSEVLALTYRDHPPMTAWMMYLGTRLLGETALGLRLFAVLLSVPAAFGVYLIGREMHLSVPQAVSGTLLSTMLIAPASAAVICTPDTFLGVSWIFGVLAALRLRRGASPVWWYGFAAVFAVGMWSKLSALLLLPLIFLALGYRRPIDRRRDRTIHPIAAAFLSLLLISPFVAAEIQQDGGAAAFQLAHLSGRLPGAEPEVPFIAAIRILEVISGQIGLLTPLVAVWVAVYLLRSRNEVSPVLKAAVLLPMGAATLAGFFTHPEQNWASLGHPMVGPLVVAALDHLFLETSSRPKRFRPAAALTLGTAVAAFVLVHVHCLAPILPLPPERDPTARLHGWSVLRPLARNVETADAVVCDNYGLAAQLDWELRDRSKALPVITSPDRKALPAPGNWLLLSQENDFGRVALPQRCKEVRSKGLLNLTLPDGRPWDRIRVAWGIDCRP